MIVPKTNSEGSHNCSDAPVYACCCLFILFKAPSGALNYAPPPKRKIIISCAMRIPPAFGWTTPLEDNNIIFSTRMIIEFWCDILHEGELLLASQEHCKYSNMPPQWRERLLDLPQVCLQNLNCHLYLQHQLPLGFHWYAIHRSKKAIAGSGPRVWSLVLRRGVFSERWIDCWGREISGGLLGQYFGSEVKNLGRKICNTTE